MGFSLSGLGAAALVGSAALGAIGAIGQGEAAAAQADYQAQVAKNNATIANQNANYAIAAGEAKATDQALRERARLGAVTASLAASGLDVNTGSPEKARQTTAEIGQLDTERTRAAAAREAYGFRTTAANQTAQAGLEEAEEGPDVAAGLLRGGSTILAGLGTVGFKWAGLQDESAALGDWSPRPA